LFGEGIECEKESRRLFLASPDFEVFDLSVAELLQKDFNLEVKKNDLFFIPGGFSFADHFGSGRLLSYLLQEKAFFNSVIDGGGHLMGVCNGFQMLCQAGLFGENVELKKNRQGSFCNRWVQVKWQENEFCFPVRHGEGRLTVEGALASHVESFLHYNDPSFDNGSFEQIAGLKAKIKESYLWGMMPHPEIVLRSIDEPNRSPRENILQDPAKSLELKGPAFDFIAKVLREMKIK